MVDDVWSSIGSRDLGGNDHEDALRTADILEGLVVDASHSATDVLRLYVEHAGAFSEDLKEVVLPRIHAASTVADEVLDGLGYNFDAMAHDGTEGLVSSVDSAVSALKEERQDLGPDRDVFSLPHAFMCNFAQCTMVAGALATWVPPHLQGPAVLGVGAVIYKANGCRKKR